VRALFLNLKVEWLEVFLTGNAKLNNCFLFLPPKEIGDGFIAKIQIAHTGGGPEFFSTLH